jgi:hypothetical protein
MATPGLKVPLDRVKEIREGWMSGFVANRVSGAIASAASVFRDSITPP